MSNLADHLAEQAEITAAHDTDAPEQIEGMECPQCGQRECFHIAATVWGRHTANGFDSMDEGLPDHDSDWDQYAACRCPACAKSGIVEDFLI